MGKPRGKRHPSSRRVKRHRSYRVDEAAIAVDSCRATIRRWIKNGLPTVQDTRPALILGSDLIDYLDRKPRGPKCALADEWPPLNAKFSSFSLFIDSRERLLLKP